MARNPQSDRKTVRPSDLLTRRDSSLSSLLRRASFLVQLQHLLSGHLDPALAANFQVANLRRKRLILLASSAVWATRLRMQAPALIEALRRSGCADVDHVEVRVAPPNLPPTVPAPSDKPRKPLTPAARQAFDIMRSSRLKKGK